MDARTGSDPVSGALQRSGSLRALVIEGSCDAVKVRQADLNSSNVYITAFGGMLANIRRLNVTCGNYKAVYAIDGFDINGPSCVGSSLIVRGDPATWVGATLVKRSRGTFRPSGSAAFSALVQDVPD